MLIVSQNKEKSNAVWQCVQRVRVCRTNRSQRETDDSQTHNLGVSEDTVRVMEYRGKNERYRRTKKGPMPGFGTRYKIRKVEVDG